MTTIQIAYTPDTSHSAVTDAVAPYEVIEAWPAGKLLFREGTVPDGIYFLHSGDVELCFSARPLLIAKAGQFLGLTSVMSDRPHDASATTRTPCVTGFIEKNRFLNLLEEKPALWLTVLQMISSNINACWDCMRARGR